MDSKRKIAKKEYEVYRTVTEHHYFYVYADSQEEAERLAETDECYCDSLGHSLADTDVETESVRLRHPSKDMIHIEWVHHALQEAINGCADEAMLTQALELVEEIRERIE